MEDLTGYEWSTKKARRRQLPYPREYKLALSGEVPGTIVVDSKSLAMDVRVQLMRAPYVALDTEFDETGKLVCWQASDGKLRAVIPPDRTRHFKSWLADPNKRKVFHHANADLKIFELNGVDVQGFHGDTMIMDWFLDENRRRHGLKSCCQDWLDLPLTEYADAFGYVPEKKKKRVVPPIWEVWEQNRERFLEYASLDAYGTWWLFKHHTMIMERLQTGDTNLWAVYYTHDVDYTSTLRAMMDRGMRIDVDILHDIGNSLEQEMARARHIFSAFAPSIQVSRVAGGEPYVVVIQAEDVNLNSPQQLASLFYDELGYETFEVTRSGKSDPTVRTTNEAHLRYWEQQHQSVLATCILAHRRAATQRGTFIGEEGGKGLLAHVHFANWTGMQYYRVNTDLNQIGTVTGRLSSRDPNLQNIPNRKDKDPYRMRRAFIARAGCKLVVADYSGAELRVMAHYSQDQAMITAFKKGLDLHSYTAKSIFGLRCSLEAVKTDYPDQRTIAKNINFGLQYGMQAWLLAKYMGLDVQEAQRYIDAYFDLYSGVKYWMRRTVEKCRQRGYVTTLLGRRRRVRDINLPKKFSSVGGTKKDINQGKRKHAENQAMNFPIQGSVADIIKIAMNQIEKSEWMKLHEAQLLLQVHDELIVECPWIDAHTVKVKVKEIMESAYVLRVPLIVDAAVGDNWEDAKA